MAPKKAKKQVESLDLPASSSSSSSPNPTAQAIQSKERSDSLTSGGSAHSAHSINYVVAAEKPRKISGILKAPTIGVNLEKDETGENRLGENRLILKIGTDRPPTTLENIQGRHVSTYVLYREAMINRINGKDVERVEELLKGFMAEYIETASVLESFHQYTNLIKERSGDVFFDKEKRIAIYDEREETLTLVEKDLPPELQGDILSPQAQELVQKLLDLKERVKKTNISPMQMRNQIKQGNIFFYQTPVVEMMKAVLTVFNKTEQAVFKDRRAVDSDQQRSEQGAQGGKASHMPSRMRAGYLDSGGKVELDKIT